MAEPTQDRNKPVGASGGLDARQRQIKEGAGLDESRVNQEFVEFLRVWLPWILGAIAVVLGGWVGWQRWTQHKHQVIAQAFADYDAAVMPANSGLDLDVSLLIRLAEEHAGKASIPELSRLAAANQLMLSASKGIAPGAELDPATGNAKNATDLLTIERQRELVQQASGLYEQVLTSTRGVKGRELFAIQAMMGLAATSEGKGEWDKAKQYYTDAKGLAEASVYPKIALVAEERMKTIDELKGASPLLPKDLILSYSKPQATAPSGQPGTMAVPITINPPAGGTSPSSVPGLTLPSATLDLSNSLLPPPATPAPAPVPAAPDAPPTAPPAEAPKPEAPKEAPKSETPAAPANKP
jgi:predicted negative regulator of RcsB-dependent stress response